MRILLVEDEKFLAEALVQILRKNHYSVDNVYNGEDGLDYALSGVYDVILLDIMLPKMDGLTVLKNLRKEDLITPVIMLTARGEIADKVAGLDSGADDYLPKPFDTEELLARIRALGRRKGEITSTNNTISFGDITIFPDLLKISTKTDEIKISAKEYNLLEYLIKNSQFVLSKEQIIEKVWGYDSEAADNHVEVYMSFLRKKLAHINSEVNILTIRGAGYKLCLKD